MTDHPVLEVALAVVAADPARRPDLIAALAEHPLHYPVLGVEAVDGGVALQLLPLDGDVCGFTTPQRWQEFLTASERDEQWPTVALTSDELAVVGLGDLGIVINPGAYWATTISSDELAGPAVGDA